VLERLRHELARAVVVPDGELPDNVIALNSTVELEDLTHNEVDQYTLVWPDQADIDEGKISILAPLGVGMIGFKVGDQFEWETPAGMITYRVRQVSRNAQAQPLVESINEPPRLQ
jgi:regulator of nucleoside diphosphate kinase